MIGLLLFASTAPAGETFDIFLMGIVSEIHYDANPPFIKMKVIEGALNRTGQEVAVVIPDEGLSHWKKRIKVGMELDARVRILEDGRYLMATAQLRAIPSREYKGGPSIEDTIKQNLAK